MFLCPREEEGDGGLTDAPFKHAAATRKLSGRQARAASCSQHNRAIEQHLPLKRPCVEASPRACSLAAGRCNSPGRVTMGSAPTHPASSSTSSPQGVHSPSEMGGCCADRDVRVDFLRTARSCCNAAAVMGSCIFCPGEAKGHPHPDSGCSAHSVCGKSSGNTAQQPGDWAQAGPRLIFGEAGGSPLLLKSGRVISCLHRRKADMGKEMKGRLNYSWRIDLL